MSESERAAGLNTFSKTEFVIFFSFIFLREKKKQRSINMSSCAPVEGFKHHFAAGVLLFRTIRTKTDEAA